MRVALAFALALGTALCGCGMSDELPANQATFAIEAKFELSTSNPSWRVPPPAGVPAWVCEGHAALVSDCCHTPSGGEFDCGRYPLRCDVDGFCALAFDYEVPFTVDLEATPELDAFRGRAMTTAFLEEFTLLADGAVLPVRSMDLYVAPAGTSWSEAGAVYLATREPPTDRSEIRVPLSAAARASLASFLLDFHTPFDLVLVSHVVITRSQLGAGAYEWPMSVTFRGTVIADF